jgi:hypothetical protein
VARRPLLRLAVSGVIAFSALVAVSGAAMAASRVYDETTTPNRVRSTPTPAPTPTPYTYSGPFSNLKGGWAIFVFEQNAQIYCTASSEVTSLTAKLDYRYANIPSGSYLVLHLWANGGSDADQATVEANYTIIYFPSGLQGSGTLNVTIAITHPFTTTKGGILIVSDVFTSKTNSLNCSESTPTPTPTATPTEEPTPTPTATPTEEPTPTPTATPTEEPTPTPTATPTEEPTPTVEPTPTPTVEPTPTPTEEPTPTPTPTEDATPTPTVEPTPTPTETPFESFEGETATPEATPTPTETPFESFEGETATPQPTTTPPPTSTSDGSSNGGSTPLFALLICLAFGGLGLAAVQSQRKSIRR